MGIGGFLVWIVVLLLWLFLCFGGVIENPFFGVSKSFDFVKEEKMGSSLHRVLRSFCLGTDWKYAIFWKLKHRARMYVLSYY